MTEKAVTFGPNLSGVLDGKNAKGSIILTHGAGAGMNSALLVRTFERLVERGFVVLRFNFAYFGNRPAPSAGGKVERGELQAAIDFMSKYGPPVIIGKSFGGRVASHVAATRDDVRALVFYGLPLQGAGKNAKVRDWSHLSLIKAPVLFITGEKDSLCPLPQLDDALKLMRARYESKTVPGDHSFKPKSEDLAMQICTDWVTQLVTS